MASLMWIQSLLVCADSYCSIIEREQKQQQRSGGYHNSVHRRFVFVRSYKLKRHLRYGAITRATLSVIGVCH